MTIETARKLFPKETLGKSDKELEIYCHASELLSDIFINKIADDLQKLLDNGKKTIQ